MVNETLIKYCADHGIEFTHSRAYRSNDQAWVEQKNGSVVRRFVRHDRHSGHIAEQTMVVVSSDSVLLKKRTVEKVAAIAVVLPDSGSGT